MGFLSPPPPFPPSSSPNSLLPLPVFNFGFCEGKMVVSATEERRLFGRPIVTSFFFCSGEEDLRRPRISVATGRWRECFRCYSDFPVFVLATCIRLAARVWR